MSSSLSVRPEFLIISVEAGQSFMRQVVDYCIERFPDLVDMVHKGRMPLAMLEYPPVGKKGLTIGRKAGSYLKVGILATVDQTVTEYREDIIAETIAGDLPLSTTDANTARTGALAILFPEADKVSRQKFRAHMEANTRALLQLLSMSWPSMDIQTRLAVDVALNEAYERQDLIEWVRSFNKFCLNSSGNKQLNKQNAEKALETIKMKGVDLPVYVKDFVKAAENLKAVESLWDDLRIVSTFIKGLNQSETVFNNIHRKFSDKNEAVYKLQKEKLSVAVTWVEDHFKEVIVPHIAEKKQEMQTLSTAKDVHQKVSQFTKRGGSSNHSNSDIAKVPITVLATLVSDNAKLLLEKRRSEEQLAAANKRAKTDASKLSKAKVDQAKPNSADVDKAKSKVTFKSTAKCHKHASQEGCSYGDRCKFSHTA